MYAYADHVQKLGGQVAAILCDPYPDPSYNVTFHRFVDRFGERRVADVGNLGRSYWSATSERSRPPDQARHIRSLLVQDNVTHLYIKSHGSNSSQFTSPWRLIPKAVRTCVHAVFAATTPWGDAYAKLAPSPVVNGDASVLPNMVERPRLPSEGLRATLGIPASATVFCSYGGAGSFNLGFVKDVVCELASSASHLVFLFANQPAFCNLNGDAARRDLHVPSLGDGEKGKFLATCDAMLHGRAEGETFGLAVAEFSRANRPVFAYAHPKHGGREHLRLLGSRAQLFQDKTSLRHMLLQWNRSANTRDWDAYKEYGPARVMDQFCRVCM